MEVISLALARAESRQDWLRRLDWLRSYLVLFRITTSEDDAGLH